MRDRAPVYRNLVSGFDALRNIALREGDMIEENLATENGGEMLIRAPAHIDSHVHSAHAALCCWSREHAAHSQPALRSGLMASIWRSALCI
jgi:hypothetical protein